jgi:hypothetical protein
MKKIININFQGRVIPIEETAYDILKHYIESLRRYFAGEEGRDEIINDIESRIAELFSDRLKRSTTCITDEDVNSVIAGIGRPEDLEEAEGSHTSTSGTATLSNEAEQGPNLVLLYAVNQKVVYDSAILIWQTVILGFASS